MTVVHVLSRSPLTMWHSPTTLHMQWGCPSRCISEEANVHVTVLHILQMSYPFPWDGQDQTHSHLWFKARHCHEEWTCKALACYMYMYLNCMHVTCTHVHACTYPTHFQLLCPLHLLCSYSAWMFCMSVQMGLWLWLPPPTSLSNLAAFWRCPLNPVSIQLVFWLLSIGIFGPRAGWNYWQVSGIP